MYAVYWGAESKFRGFFLKFYPLKNEVWLIDDEFYALDDDDDDGCMCVGVIIRLLDTIIKLVDGCVCADAAAIDWRHGLHLDVGFGKTDT